MPPSTDPRVLECVELVLAGDGTPEALSQALDDAGLKCTESARRNIRKHVSKRREEELAAEAAKVAKLLPAEAAAKAAAAAAQLADLAAQSAAQAAAAAAKEAKKAKAKTPVAEVVGGRRSRKMANNVRVAAQEKEEKCKAAFKEACLTYEAQKGQPGVTAPAVCELVGLAHGLSPDSKPKHKTVKNFVREGRAGKSPGKKGPKPKWSSEVVQAVIHAGHNTRGGRRSDRRPTRGHVPGADQRPHGGGGGAKGAPGEAGRCGERASGGGGHVGGGRGGRGCRGAGGKAPVHPLR